jgi:hypothetical protein
MLESSSAAVSGHWASLAFGFALASIAYPTFTIGPAFALVSLLLACKGLTSRRWKLALAGVVIAFASMAIYIAATW